MIHNILMYIFTSSQIQQKNQLQNIMNSQVYKQSHEINLRQESNQPISGTNKIYADALQAIQGIKDGSQILIGGFGYCGFPMNLVNAVRVSGAKQLKIVSHGCGSDAEHDNREWGLNMLLNSKQIQRLTTSHVGQNSQIQRQYFNGEIQLQVCPQGTLAQKIRSGGAGIPAFYTKTGTNTIIQTGGYVIKYRKTQQGLQPQEVSQPKPTKNFKGIKYLEQQTIFSQFALIKAKKADTSGNLSFHKSAMNFNADMAKAAKCVIVEVQQIVEAGKLNPQCINVPGIYVDRIYKIDPKNKYSQKIVQRLTVKDKIQRKINIKFSQIAQNKINFKKLTNNIDKKQIIRQKIAKRAAKQLKNGMNVNLGLGIPTVVPSFLPEGVFINIHSENGVLGVGPNPTLDQVDPDNINARKEVITLQPGGSYLSSSESFAIVRGSHLDVTMLGAYQVSEHCDMANWMISGKTMKGMGGAMDLVASDSRVIVLMQHSAIQSNGRLSTKMLSECTFPLTGKGVVSMVVTELAVFQNINGKLILVQLAEDTTLQQVQAQTNFSISCSQKIKRF